MTTLRKKLIEVALPLEAINKASAREKSIRHGHPSTLHLWWARRPLAAARAVIFAQMVDDPSAHPDKFPTEEAQEKERQRLFRLIEELVQWENTTNEAVLTQARDEIWKSWRVTCAENKDHPRATELFNPDKLPVFHDPFAGGGSLPLEAQRLGLESYASDLNPVAVLINKAMIEIPPKFAGKPPVNPGSRKEGIRTGSRKEKRGNRGEADGTALQGTRGLAESDESSSRSVSSGAETPAGGNIRDALSDHAGGGLDSGEHRRGLGEGVEQGEGAVSRDRSGIVGRVGYTADPLRADRLVSYRGDAGVAEPDGRSGADTHNDASQPPLTPISSPLPPTSSLLFPISYKGAQGLAEDVRYYGQWMRDEAEKRIGHLYPKVEITAEMAKERLDLKPLVGRKLTVIAWLWARTVKSPNPAFAQVDVPLVSTFMLSTKPGKEAYVEPVIEGIENRKEKIGNSTSAGRSSPTSSFPSSTSSFLPPISSFLAPTSTGWDTFLDAVIRAGFAVSGTWPMRTELSNRMIGSGTNALASSIILVCRPRSQDAPTATRREFLTALKRDLPEALAHLQRGNIAPVDLAQAAIGPGMAVFTRYTKVLDAEGKAMRVREALALINQTLDEVLAEQEGDFDADSRWALSWFEQFGFTDSEYGVAETLSKAKNTSVGGMVEAGILASKGGKVHLFKPAELPPNWDPATDPRLTAWEMVHHLIRSLEAGGESAAAALVAKLGGKAEIARELCYRLYTLCERKKRAQEALSYNGLVQSWPEIVRLAGQKPEQAQEELF